MSVDLFVDAFRKIFVPIQKEEVVATDPAELDADHLPFFHSHKLNPNLRCFLWELDYPSI